MRTTGQNPTLIGRVSITDVAKTNIAPDRPTARWEAYELESLVEMPAKNSTDA